MMNLPKPSPATRAGMCWASNRCWGSVTLKLAPARRSGTTAGMVTLAPAPGSPIHCASTRCRTRFYWAGISTKTGSATSRQITPTRAVPAWVWSFVAPASPRAQAAMPKRPSDWPRTRILYLPMRSARAMAWCQCVQCLQTVLRCEILNCDYGENRQLALILRKLPHKFDAGKPEPTRSFIQHQTRAYCIRTGLATTGAFQFYPGAFMSMQTKRDF